MTEKPWEGSQEVGEWICSYTPDRRDDSPMCGRPAVYELDFGWDSGFYSLACAEHAAFAREKFDVQMIWSV